MRTMQLGVMESCLESATNSVISPGTRSEEPISCHDQITKPKAARKSVRFAALLTFAVLASQGQRYTEGVAARSNEIGQDYAPFFQVYHVIN